MPDAIPRLRASPREIEGKVTADAARVGSCWLQMKFHGIDEVDLISLLRKPEGVNTCPAPGHLKRALALTADREQELLGCGLSPVRLRRMKAVATPGFSNNVLGFLAEGPSSPP